MLSKCLRKGGGKKGRRNGWKEERGRGEERKKGKEELRKSRRRVNRTQVGRDDRDRCQGRAEEWQVGVTVKGNGSKMEVGRIHRAGFILILNRERICFLSPSLITWENISAFSSSNTHLLKE